MEIVVFQLDTRLFAFELSFVERVIQAVAITPLPNAVAPYIGVINVSGEVIPVINMRKMFGFPDTNLEPQHQFLICHFNQHRVALWVDNVSQVLSCTETEQTPMEQIVQDIKGISFVIKKDDKVIFVCEPIHETTRT